MSNGSATPLAGGSSTPTISVVIATRNLRGDLEECLRSIDVSVMDSLREVVIVDDASKQPVSLAVDRVDYPVRILRNPRRLGAAVSRNRGARTAQGEILAFLDDDARVAQDWFGIILRELTPGRAAITGPVIAFDSGLIASARQARYDARYAGLESGAIVSFLAGGNAAVWKAVFDEVGGYPDVASMSDHGLVRRMSAVGASCHFIPALRIRHRNSKGAVEAVRQAWQSGRWLGRHGASPSGQVARGGGRGPQAVNHLLMAVHRTGAVWAKLRDRGNPDAPEASGPAREPAD